MKLIFIKNILILWTRDTVKKNDNIILHNIYKFKFYRTTKSNLNVVYDLSFPNIAGFG